MSSEIKWIKIVTDIFDDEKILLIESLPEADSIIIIWFKLLCLAGKQNNSGVFTLNDKIPYTENMLATIFRRKESTVTLALNTFKNFGMIEIINDTITIPNWEKHQQLDAFEISKEKTRNRVNRYREKQKLLTQNECNVTVTSCNGDRIDKDIDNIYILGQKEGQNEVNDDPAPTEQDKKTEILDRFEIFWELYPRKVKKQKAQEWFLKNKPNNDVFDNMINKLKQYINSNDWKKNDGQFIPHPTTWLNQERWLDEVEEKNQSSSQNIVQTGDNTFKLK